jgi:Protein kinase domain
MTTPTQFQKIRQYLHDLMDLNAAEQAQRLLELHRSDPEAATTVADLLARIAPEDLQPQPRAPALAPGRRIGPFELVELIGSGGMGVVYRARRVDGMVTQQVAIKLSARSLLLPREERRLKRERDFLAQLQHPHIARLLDAGAEPGVGPWFAMEFVEGVSITRYADQHKLDIRRRLELWLQLADAVVYAHQHLIVHRDLKPANVLVDARGQAKLLDFGVANLFQPDGDLGQSLPAFTPRYASPEQIAGEPITTATDVHGLGLLFYELLCARPAFSDRSDLALRQAIAHTEPPSMRSALTQLQGDELSRASAARALTRQQWDRALGGELQAIVAKSLRKQPQERYASAREFADDVQRYLHGEKVIAMAPSWRYRAGKFLRRHRGAVAALSALSLAIAIGVIGTLQQRDRALAAQAQAHAENGLLVDVLGGGPDTVAGGPDLRVRDLLRSSVPVVAARIDLTPVSRAKLLHTLGEGMLTLLDDAEADKTLALAEQALAAVPGLAPDLELRLKLKRSWIRFEGGAHDQAMAATQALWPQIQRAGVAVQLEALQNRAHFHAALRAFDAALNDLDAAQKLATTMQPLPQRDLSQIRYNRIHVLMNLQRNDEAYVLAEQHWAAADARPTEFISARINAAEMLARAASKVDRSVEAEQRLLAILPSVETLYQGRGNRLASVVGALASAQRGKGAFRDAARNHLRQAELRHQALPDSIYVASAQRFAGISLYMLGDAEGALIQLRRARDGFERLHSDAEVMHCDLYMAAAEFMRQPSATALQALQAKVDQIVLSGEPSDRIEAPIVLIEAAHESDNRVLADRYLQQLRIEISHQQPGRTLNLHLAVLDAEYRQSLGEALELNALRDTASTLGNVYLLARLQSLRLRQKQGDSAAADCAAAEQAWALVDPQGLAWRRAGKARCVPDVAG